jgi:UDP-galactopyranose mutase
MYNSKTEKYEVRDRTDREVYEEYDSFAAFFEHVVGGRLGLYTLDDEDPDEAQYEHDEGRYDGEV